MNILKKYILNKISDSELNAEFLRRYNLDILADDLSPEQVNSVFMDLSSVENIDLLLKSILKKDRVRYFNAQIETQPVIKGAYMRTIWLLKAIREKRDRKVEQADLVKFTSPRHG